MGDTKIEWTDATWNPVRGCSPVSAGCDNCYAAAYARRFQRDLVDNDGHWNGYVECLPERLEQPLHWKKPRMVFVESMGDLFHEQVPDKFIRWVIETILMCPQHTFQILTKRPHRARSLKNFVWWPPNVPNLWMGVSVENSRVFERIRTLEWISARVRFLSCEPLLEPLDNLPLDGISWVIVGGESGPGARPCRVKWIRSIIDQCDAAGVRVFVKQLGNASDWPHDRGKRNDPTFWPEEVRVRDYPAS